MTLGLLMAALLVAAPLGSTPPLLQRSSWSVATDAPPHLSCVLWNKTYGTIYSDSCHSLVHCRNGGYALIGSTGTGGGSYRTLMVRVDEGGEQLWNRTFPEQFMREIAQTDDDGFVIFVGYSTGALPNFGGMRLHRLDYQGNYLWSRSYSDPPTDGDQHLGLTFTSCQDGGFALLGIAEDFLAGQTWEPWIVRTDANGTILWNRVYRSQQPGLLETDIGRAICECSDGGFALTGETSNAWLLRVDSEGNHLWNRTYEPAYLHGLVECSDGGLALAGYAFNESTFGPPYTPLVIRTDSQGNTLWQQTYGSSGDDTFSWIVELEDGGFALAGSTNSSGSGGDDMMLVRISANGSLLWKLTVGGSADDWGSALVRIPGSGFAVAGSTASFGAGGYDMWLVRFPEPEGTPPTWAEPPADQKLLVGVPFRYDLNASDASGISHWQLNDTTHFAIDDEGVVMNATMLAVGSYGLQVVVYDIYNNALSGAFTVLVVVDPVSIVIGVSILVLGVLLPASFLAVFAWRRYTHGK